MTALTALLGLGVATGIMLIVIGLHGRPAADAARMVFRRRCSVPARARRLAAGRWVGAIVVGAVVWLLTGWPVAGVAVFGLLAFLPWLFGAPRLARARIDRLEALGEWTRRLADLMASGRFGLHGAIQASGSTAPAAIATEVATLVQRLRRWEVEAALLAFADELDDPVGDAVSAGLIVAHRQGSGIADVLRSLAASVSTEVSLRRRVEAERARPRSTARLLTIMSLVLFAGLAAVGREAYLDVYRTLHGQLVLATVIGLLAAALIWMRRLSIGAPPPRFLAGRSR